MRPIAKYFGAKYRLAPHYGPPTRRILCEPFAGFAGYALYWNWPDTILVEKYEVVANIWQWLINDATEADIAAVPDEAHNRDMVPGPKPLRDLVGFWFIKGDTRPRRKMTPHTFDRRAHGDGQFWGAAVKERLIGSLPLIRKWRIIHGDYTLAPDSPDIFTYCDPPYQHQGSIYHHGSKELDYQKLGVWCKNRNTGIVCESMAADWLPFEEFREYTNQSGGEYTEAIYRINPDSNPCFAES